MLSSEYNMSIGGFYLAAVHPDTPAGLLIKVPRMDKEMQLVHDFEIECGRATASKHLDTPFVL